MTLGVAVLTTPEDVEFVSDLLWGLGIVALSEHDRPDGRIMLRTSLGEDRKAVETAMSTLPLALDWTFEQIDDAIGTEWRDHVQSIVIGDELEIVPAWIASPPSVTRHRISIEPGSTFGLGDHPTTVGCLHQLVRLARSGDTVLDVGCGSGVLGVAALVMGSSHAVGVDIAPASVGVSEANARRNGVADRWLVTTDSLDTIHQKFDLVFANILAPVLVALSGDLRRLVATNGRLVISGVLDRHHEHVLEALEPMVVVDKIVIDGWATIVLS